MQFWARQNTGPGDANFDHLFDSSDFVSVFQRGKYESNSPASWSDGDWNCDGVLGSADLVAAFQRGWYEAGVVNEVVRAVDRFESSREHERPSRDLVSLDALWRDAASRGGGGSTPRTVDPRVVYDPVRRRSRR